MIIIEELKDNKIDLEQFDTVPYGPDMFFLAINSIIQHEYAVAVDEENQPVALLILMFTDINIQAEQICLL